MLSWLAVWWWNIQLVSEIDRMLSTVRREYFYGGNIFRIQNPGIFDNLGVGGRKWVCVMEVWLIQEGAICRSRLVTMLRIRCKLIAEYSGCMMSASELPQQSRVDPWHFCAIIQWTDNSCARVKCVTCEFRTNATPMGIEILCFWLESFVRCMPMPRPRCSIMLTLWETFQTQHRTIQDSWLCSTEGGCQNKVGNF